MVRKEIWIIHIKVPETDTTRVCVDISVAGETVACVRCSRVTRVGETLYCHHETEDGRKVNLSAIETHGFIVKEVGA